jgi:hypothetical protein
MRVVSHNAMFPLLSETYIEEEMLALELQGAAVAFSAFQPSISPYPVRQPVFSSLDEAIAAHNPDVLVLYWTSHALGELSRLEGVGRPFALRVHSFDFEAGHRPRPVERLRAHPGRGDPAGLGAGAAPGGAGQCSARRGLRAAGAHLGAALHGGAGHAAGNADVGH